MTSRARWVSGAGAAVLLALAGCGTTVRGATGTMAQDETTIPGPGGQVASAPAGGLGTTGAVPGGSTAIGGGSGTTTGAAQLPANGTVTGGTPGATSVPGVTATTIRVGIVYTAGADQAARAAGVPLNRGNEKSYWQAAIDEVNARGGIAGRRLVPVYEVYEGQSTQTRATQEQAWCARFTQDDRVFAVISVGSMDFEACLARAGVLHPTTGSYVGFDREFYQRYPLYFGQRPSQERLQTDLVSALVRQKYFTGWDTFRGAPGAAKSVVGVLATEEAFITRTVPRVLLPALAKAGHRVDPSAVYHVHSTDAGRASANVQAAVLGFRQKGVTHVVVLDTIGQSTFNFSQQAASQAYYPRLGVTSASGIQQFYDLGVLRPQQVSGVAGLGWTPTLDLPLGQADQYLTKEAPQCLAVMKRRAGVTFDSTTAAGLATMSCDAVFTFAGALQLAGRDLTLATAVRAYEAVGRRLVTATVGRLFFAPTHHDGLEVAYDMVWDNSCTCIRYPDGAHRMP